MKTIYFIAAIFISVLWLGCTKEGRLDHIDEKAPAPGVVNVLSVESTPGGAKLTYKIPVDPNFAYVKAVYEIQPGVFREAKSSIYSDTINVIGYGDTKNHVVSLFSIGKNEKSSGAVNVTITPTTPAVQDVFANLVLRETFSGVNIIFQNNLRGNISINVLVDTTGKNTWAPVTTFYTGAAAGNFSARGFQPVEKRFAVVIKDRWNNKSDTLIKKLTPLFEMEIPKAPFRLLKLPTDTWQTADDARYNVAKLWDGIIGGSSYVGIYAGPNTAVLPNWFTIDLGGQVELSRFKEFQTNTSHLYNASGVKKFQLWGSNAPNADGSFDSWTLLGTFDSFKPSGLPIGTVSAEDRNYATFLGEDFNFETPPAAYRFIRFKTLETYSSNGQIVVAELTFFGQVR